MTSSQRAIVHLSPSDPLSLETIAAPTPTTGSVVVRVLATSLISYMRDVLTGQRPYPVSLPLVPGLSCIGRVSRAGPDSVYLRTGQLVYCDMTVRARDNPGTIMLMGLSSMTPKAKPLMDGEWRNSTWAEIAKFPLENVHVLDDDLLLDKMGYSPADLCWMGACMVSFGGLDEIGLRQGETVIVAPSTGYFGGADVQVALAMGAKVVAMGSNEAILQRLEEVFGNGRLSVVKISGKVETDNKTLATAAPNGAEVFLDLSPPVAAGISHFRAVMETLKPWGRMVLMGGIVGNVELNYQQVQRNCLRIQGKSMYSREQAVRTIKLVEGGYLKWGPGAGVQSKVFGLGAIDEALNVAEQSNWGTTVVVEP